MRLAGGVGVNFRLGKQLQPISLRKGLLIWSPFSLGGARDRQIQSRPEGPRRYRADRVRPPKSKAARLALRIGNGAVRSRGSKSDGLEIATGGQ